jgi:hypothetical protein
MEGTAEAATVKPTGLRMKRLTAHMGTKTII